MSRNQLHGKKFEDFIKGCGLFPGSSDSGRGVTAGFDIEAKFDRERGLPTSVKTTGNDTIALSDARRFFEIDRDFRMLVGKYHQQGTQKVFAEIHEFIASTDVLNAVRGDLDMATVTAFHEGLLIGKFSKGEHVAAREWARHRKTELSGVKTDIILNPKIDSKTQRRLQCSIRIDDLARAAQAHGKYIIHTDAIGDFALPIIQNSARRTFQESGPS